MPRTAFRIGPARYHLGTFISISLSASQKAYLFSHFTLIGLGSELRLARSETHIEWVRTSPCGVWGSDCMTGRFPACVQGPREFKNSHCRGPIIFLAGPPVDGDGNQQSWPPCLLPEQKSFHVTFWNGQTDRYFVASFTDPWRPQNEK